MRIKGEGGLDSQRPHDLETRTIDQTEISPPGGKQSADAGTVDFAVNEVNVQIGSTVFFQAQPGGEMAIRVIEGSVQVSAFDTTYEVTTGNEVTVPVDGSLKAAGPPTAPTPYNREDVRALPLELLDQLVPSVPAKVKHGKEPPGLAGETPGESHGNSEANPPGQEEKITLCHNGVTITVAASAVPAHLTHGDTIGVCPSGAGPGRRPS